MATSLTILCTNAWFISGAPLYAEVDGRPAFPAWDKAVRLDLRPGMHGVEIFHSPPSSVVLGGKANHLSTAVELHDGFHYTLTYQARLAPFRPAKVTIANDRTS